MLWYKPFLSIETLCVTSENNCNTSLLSEDIVKNILDISTFNSIQMNANLQNFHKKNGSRFLKPYIYICVSVCVCIYLYIHIYQPIYIYIYIYIYNSIYLYISIYIDIYIYIHIYTYIDIYLYIFLTFHAIDASRKCGKMEGRGHFGETNAWATLDRLKLSLDCKGALKM